MVHIFFYIFWHQTAHYLRETPKSIQANTHTHIHTHIHTHTQTHRYIHHTHTLACIDLGPFGEFLLDNVQFGAKKCKKKYEPIFF